MLLDPHLVLPWRCQVERLRARQLDELTRAKWLGFNRGSRCLEMMPTKQWEDIPTTCKKWQDTDRCLWFQVPSPHLIVFFVTFLWGGGTVYDRSIYIYMYMISSKLLLEFPVSLISRRDSHSEHLGRGWNSMMSKCGRRMLWKPRKSWKARSQFECVWMWVELFASCVWGFNLYSWIQCRLEQVTWCYYLEYAET